MRRKIIIMMMMKTDDYDKMMRIVGVIRGISSWRKMRMVMMGRSRTTLMR